MTHETDDDATAKRFSLIEIEDRPTAKKIAPDEAPAVTVAPVQAPASTFAAPVMASAQAVKAAVQDQDTVRAYLGKDLLNATAFEVGTALMAEGQATARKLYAGHQALPTVPKAMAAAIATVQAEGRKDYMVPLSQVRLDERGILTRANGGLRLDDHSWSQLVAKAPTAPARVQGQDNVPEIVKHNVNSWIGQVSTEMRFRTRNPDKATSTRECFAILSRKYQVCDLDAVAAMVARVFPADAKAHVEYDADSTHWRIDVSLANEQLVKEAAVGQIFKMGSRITGADNGTASIKSRPFAVRIRCLNCTLVTDEGTASRRRHTGTDMVRHIRQALTDVAGGFKRFAEEWSMASQRRIHDAYDGTPLGAKECFRRLIAAGYVQVGGMEPSDLLAVLMTAWDKEPGDTAAHVNMAITRAAHESEKVSIWGQELLEEQAGEVLFQRVYQLEPLTSGQVDLF